METRLLSDEVYLEQLSIVTDELIDQYASAQLPVDERERVERFILESPKRQQKLRFAIALRRRASEWKEQNSRSRRKLIFYLPIAAAVLMAAGLGVWRGLFAQSDVDKGLAALRLAYRDQRPVDARVSDFNYAPTVRGDHAIDSVQRGLAGSLLLSAASQHPDASSLHALGQYYLTQHQFTDAVKQLQDALQRDPNSAKARNDLGIALLEHGKQAEANNDPGAAFKYFAESQGEFEKAIKLDNSLFEARFNLALVLEKLGLPEEAEKRWRDYLEKDSTSQWANEAGQHLRALEERRQKATTREDAETLEEFLQAYRNKDEEAAWRVLGWNREVVTGKFVAIRLVNAYLEAVNSGRKDEAENMLQALEYAGDLEARKAGELYTSEVARFYRSVAPRHIATLAKAAALASQGYELCQLSGYEKAVPLFEEAHTILDSTNNAAESAFVGYWLAFSYRYSQQTDKSRTTCEALIRYCRERNYKWLLAQLLGLLSNIQTGFHEESAVINLSSEALTLSEQLNDAYGTQKYLASLAGKYSVVYNFPEALDHLARCLRLAEDFWPGTRQAWRNYDTATQVFNRIGIYSTSAAFAEAALGVAVERSKDPSLVYLSYVHLGMAYGRLQKYEDGIKNAQSGFEIGQSLHSNAGKEIMAYSALQLGELNRLKGNLHEAAKYYDQAIAIYDQLSFQAFKFVAHRGRLLTYVAQADDAAVEQELHVLLNLFEEYRTKIKEDDNRIYFFDVVQEVYDAAIDFAHSRRRNDEDAFRYSEASRARSLLAILNADVQANAADSSLKPRDYRELKDLIPEQVQILEYAVLGDKLLIWVISRSQFDVEERAVSGAALSEQVRDYLKLVTRPSSDLIEVRRASTALYDILISPIAHHLVAGKVLCIVPDKALNHLPFAALASAKSGRYLIEDHPLLFAPSSNVFIANTRVANDKHALGGERLLSVGNPSFDRGAFPSLADLPSAAIEADAVARYYNTPAPLVLKAGAATKDRVIKGIAQSHVLHFASHYFVDERSPMHSQLLLAQPDVGMGHHALGSDSLFAQDIYQMKLTQPRLAVLSACSTAGDRYYSGEGMIGMARTFLAAGVPVVVASQWPVDTVATSGLMIQFHQYRQQSAQPTVYALRMAQTKILNDTSGAFRHPYYWAPFVTIGGYSNF